MTAIAAASEASPWRRVAGLIPAASSIAYPFLLRAFHGVVATPDRVLSAPRVAGAAVLLGLALVLPLSGLAFAYWLTRTSQPPHLNLRARRLAYASIAAPSCFVFVGVMRGLLGLSIPEPALWIALWTLGALYAWSGRGAVELKQLARPASPWRIAHGAAAALIACFVLFHLSNHLFGLVGPEAHAAIMKAGRTVYRSAIVEPLLVVLLLFQVASGLRLAWRWSAQDGDFFRVFQIGSGAYLAVYILTHMNSAFISARAVHHIDTNWAWASGAPVGLIHDAWDIRLLPHYALGVFFIVGHLFSGLRVVMLAHGVSSGVANRAWAAGLIVGAMASTAIACALCGVRL